MGHVEKKVSLDSKLQIGSICSIRMRSRKQDIFEKPFISNSYETLFLDCRPQPSAKSRRSSARGFFIQRLIAYHKSKCTYFCLRQFSELFLGLTLIEYVKSIGSYSLNCMFYQSSSQSSRYPEKVATADLTQQSHSNR